MATLEGVQSALQALAVGNHNPLDYCNGALETVQVCSDLMFEEPNVSARQNLLK